MKINELNDQTIKNAFFKSKDYMENNYNDKDTSKEKQDNYRKKERQYHIFAQKLSKKYKGKRTSIGDITNIYFGVKNGYGFCIIEVYNEKKIKLEKYKNYKAPQHFTIYYSLKNNTITTTYHDDFDGMKDSYIYDKNWKGNFQDSKWTYEDKLLFDNIFKEFKGQKTNENKVLNFSDFIKNKY